MKVHGAGQDQRHETAQERGLDRNEIRCRQDNDAHDDRDAEPGDV